MPLISQCLSLSSNRQLIKSNFRIIDTQQLPPYTIPESTLISKNSNTHRLLQAAQPTSPSSPRASRSEGFTKSARSTSKTKGGGVKKKKSYAPFVAVYAVAVWWMAYLEAHLG